MGRMIFSMHWGIINFAPRRHTFLTSDRPVITNIFPVEGNHLCLPINPFKMFFACEDRRSQQLMERIEPIEIIRTMNDATAGRAFRFVYGLDDTQLRFVENRLGRRPVKPVPF
jgi:hypothetical protein